MPHDSPSTTSGENPGGIFPHKRGGSSTQRGWSLTNEIRGTFFLKKYVRNKTVEFLVCRLMFDLSGILIQK